MENVCDGIGDSLGMESELGSGYIGLFRIGLGLDWNKSVRFGSS